MTYLEKLIETLYQSGFEAGNEEDAKIAIRLVQRLYKQGNLVHELGAFFQTEAGKDLLDMTPYEVATIKNVNSYKEMVHIVATECELEDCVLDHDTIDYYKNMAVSLGLMSNDEDLLEPFDMEPLLGEFDEAGQPIEQDQDHALDNEGLVAADDDQDHEVDVPEQDDVDNEPNLSKADREGIVEQFLNSFFARFMEGKKGKEYDEATIVRTHINYQQATDEINYFISHYFKHDEHPFLTLVKLVPNYNPEHKEIINNHVLDLIDKVCKFDIQNRAITAAVKQMINDGTDIKEVFTYLDREINKLPNRAEITQLIIEKNILSDIVRMYDGFIYPEYNAQLVEYFKSIEGIEKCVPTGALSVLTHPEISNTYPYKKEIDAYRNKLANNDPLRETLDDVNEILAVGDKNYVSLTSGIAEDVGGSEDRKRTREAIAYLKSQYPQVDIKDGGGVIEIADTAKMAEMVDKEIKKELSYDEDFKEEIGDILDDMIADGLFNPSQFPYEAEEGMSKEYAFKPLIRARKEVEQAFKEQDREAIIQSVKAYKDLEDKYDRYLDRLTQLFPDNGVITANISVSRNSQVPAKYRSNYKAVTLLNGLYHTLGFCYSTQIDFHDYLNNPVKCTYQGIDKFFSQTNLIKVFDKNAGQKERLIQDILKEKHTFVEDSGIYFAQARSAFRGAMGPLMLYQGQHESAINGGIGVISDTFYTTLTSTAVKHSMYVGPNFAKTIGNIFFVEEADINPYFVDADNEGVLDARSCQFVKAVNLHRYIEKHNNFETLLEKVKRLNAFLATDEMQKYAQDVKSYIKEEIQYAAILTQFNRQCLNNLLDKGTDIYLEAREASDNILVTGDNIDPNVVDYYQKLNRLIAATLAEHTSDNPLEQNKEFAKNFYNPKRISFYAAKFGLALLEQGVDIESFGYAFNTEDILRFMKNVVEGNLVIPHVTLPEDFFDSLDQESYEQFDVKFQIPRELAQKNFQKADAVCNAFIHVSNDTATELKELETNLANAGAHKYEYAQALRINAAHPDQPPFKVRSHSAAVQHELNPEYVQEQIQRFDTFKLSDDTKKAIIDIYHKMDEYGMLIDFPPYGEDTHKMYAFHKYYKAYSKMEEALKANDLDKAYEAAKAYPQLMAEYRDVLSMCEALLPQDGYHCPDNLSCSREEYFPREFTMRQGSHIQLNAIYNIAHFCERLNMSIEEVVNHPDRAIKKASEMEKNRYLAYASGPHNTFATVLTHHKMVADLTLGRGLDALSLLEKDDALRLNNSLLTSTFLSMTDGNYSLKHPFVKMVQGVPTNEVDYDTLKQYIGSFGYTDGSAFLITQVNPETGKNFENNFPYADFIANDKRTPEMVLDDVVKNLAQGLLAMNVKNVDHKDYIKYNHFYIGAVLYLKDYLNGHDYMANAIGMQAIRNFMVNPVENVRNYILNNYPNVPANTRLFGEGVIPTLESMGIKDDLLYRNIKAEVARITPMNINQLQARIREVSHHEGLHFNSQNFITLMLAAKRAYQLYDARSYFNTLFSSDATKEKNLEADIHSLCKKWCLPERLYSRIVYKHSDTMERDLYEVEEWIKLREKMLDLTPTRVTKRLETIFHKGNLDDLTPEQRAAYQKTEALNGPEMIAKSEAKVIMEGHPINEANLDQVIALYNDVEALLHISGVDEESKKLFLKSYNLVVDELKEKGLSRDYIIMYNQHEMTQEDLIRIIEEDQTNKLIQSLPEQVEIDDEEFELVVNGHVLDLNNPEEAHERAREEKVTTR